MSETGRESGANGALVLHPATVLRVSPELGAARQLIADQRQVVGKKNLIKTVPESRDVFGAAIGHDGAHGGGIMIAVVL